MTIDGLRPRALTPAPAETALVWFERVIAAYCLFFGILYWVRLLGVYPGASWRFDTMPAHWQVASVSLAVFYPFAAIGLWNIASWGPVMWFICAAAEGVMYGGFPDLFGHRTVIVALHACVALVYIVLRVMIYLNERRSAAG